MRPLLILPLLACLVPCLTGCSTVAGRAGGETAPLYTPVNVTGDAQLPAGLRRVVLAPLHAGAVAPTETAAELDPILLGALQRQMRFEVVAVSRAENRRWFGAESFSGSGMLPAGYVERLAAEFVADGVLLVDLTAYDPYRPLAVGFRAKLAASPQVRFIWAFDEIVSAREASVVNSARRHAEAGGRGPQAGDQVHTVLQSPARFAAFVAEAMFQTLPPR